MLLSLFPLLFVCAGWLKFDEACVAAAAALVG